MLIKRSVTSKIVNEIIALDLTEIAVNWIVLNILLKCLFWHSMSLEVKLKFFIMNFFGMRNLDLSILNFELICVWFTFNCFLFLFNRFGYRLWSLFRMEIREELVFNDEIKNFEHWFSALHFANAYIDRLLQDYVRRDSKIINKSLLKDDLVIEKDSSHSSVETI
jgi:hypothetical protein